MSYLLRQFTSITIRILPLLPPPSCLQRPDKPKLVGYAMKLDLVSLARLAGLRVVRYKIVGIQVT